MPQEVVISPISASTSFYPPSSSLRPPRNAVTVKSRYSPLHRELMKKSYTMRVIEEELRGFIAMEEYI